MDLEKYKKQCANRKKRKAIKMMDSHVDRHETLIEKKMRIFLESAGIYYVPQYAIECKIAGQRYFKTYDFFITGINRYGVEFAILIECDGDYFHARKYQEGEVSRSKLSKLQRKNLRNDSLKNNIAKRRGFPLLRFFERDIKWNFDMVKQTIFDTIDNFGIMS